MQLIVLFTVHNFDFPLLYMLQKTVSYITILLIAHKTYIIFTSHFFAA